MLMLDLFSGAGGASAAFLDRGWRVVRVDNDPDCRPDIVADLMTWRWDGPTPDFVWASPPCTEFTRSALPWFRAEPAPSLALVQRAVAVVQELMPRFWVIENVRGAIKWFRPMLGSPRWCGGPVCLWGDFPAFHCNVRPWKQRLSSRKRRERATIPYNLSRALALSIESGVLF